MAINSWNHTWLHIHYYEKKKRSLPYLTFFRQLPDTQIFFFGLRLPTFTLFHHTFFGGGRPQNSLDWLEPPSSWGTSNKIVYLNFKQFNAIYFSVIRKRVMRKYVTISCRFLSFIQHGKHGLKGNEKTVF